MKVWGGVNAVGGEVNAEKGMGMTKWVERVRCCSSPLLEVTNEGVQGAWPKGVRMN